MKRHNAQTEIIGLVLIVLLISIGMLFIVAFLISGSQGDAKRVFTDKQLAVNLNDAILTATSSCRDLSYQRLIIDCVGVQRITCGVTQEESCSFLQNNLERIFTMTLDAWGKDYRYRIYDDQGNTLLSLSNGPCQGNIEPGVFFLPVNQRTIFVRLDICE